jgi:hypothetical protein
MARYRQRRANKAPTPSPALTEMLAKTGELDNILSGRGLTFERATVIGPPTPPGPGLLIPEPDWDQEHREQLERERQARIEEATRLLEEEPPERPAAPA